MKKTYLFAALSLTLSLSAVGFSANAEDTVMKDAQAQFQPVPDKAPAIKGNEATPDKIELGKMLYFDPRLSKSGLISCNTCHNVGMAGADFQQTSTGHGWKQGPRNAPTVLNSVFNVAQFWDGRAKDLAEQAKGPIQAGVEMNNTPENVVKTLNSMPEYVALFKRSFPGESDPVTFDNMAKAIEAFEATLITPDSKFDLFLKGDAKALAQNEQEGLKLFMVHGCVECHGGVNMGGDQYYPLGVVNKPSEKIIAGDKGRFAITQAKDDEFSFKSPSLRNIELTPPYFHSGVVWELAEAVQVMNDSQIGADLKEGDIGKIVAFLKTTTGKQPQVLHPILPAPTQATPKPSLE
ncbi:Cytochrome-c peroxidase [Desulfobulbus propionicus DSM 2032]|uniref:Cytochrome-c peroxidase n=1 Tax=Desulfobulbus propionicus (strain ATCC 33891 / DSM 2032 / VKM B-1956 / 1pr3) TaxID=577650 RepID=A0A7U3YLG8_DESPD|nr:cytochrome-c peroxidase [Desulfobulbus propionicus]ADW17582.1 Cytochrome-c peroxidase [Desulfobulbus propionicus DSM 2032]